MEVLVNGRGIYIMMCESLQVVFPSIMGNAVLSITLLIMLSDSIWCQWCLGEFERE